MCIQRHHFACAVSQTRASIVFLDAKQSPPEHRQPSNFCAGTRRTRARPIVSIFAMSVGQGCAASIQSSLVPENFSTLAHLSVSISTKLANGAGP
jgi:hypothetical protein